jgi:hypothetical protein
MTAQEVWDVFGRVEQTKEQWKRSEQGRARRLWEEMDEALRKQKEEPPFLVRMHNSLEMALCECDGEDEDEGEGDNSETIAEAVREYKAAKEEWKETLQTKRLKMEEPPKGPEGYPPYDAAVDQAVQFVKAHPELVARMIIDGEITC